MTKRYESICLTESQLKEMGFSVKNNVLKSIDVDLTAHIGNSVGLFMRFVNCGLFANYKLDEMISEMLKIIIEILNLERDNGIKLSDIKNVPVRLVLDGEDGWGDKVVGFGNFMADEFILEKDLRALAKERLKRLEV